MRVLIQVGRWRVLDLELFARDPDEYEGPDNTDDEPSGSITLRGDVEPDFGFTWRNEVPSTTLRPLGDDDYED